jgi:hypothetical protein
MRSIWKKVLGVRVRDSRVNAAPARAPLTQRPGRLGWGVCAVVAVLASVAGAVPAQAATTLELSRDGSIAKVELKDNGSVTATQVVAPGASDCAIEDQDGPLLDFGAVGARGLAGFHNNSGIGLARTSQGEPCGHVRATESLSLDLGPALSDRKIAGASVTVRFYRNTRVEIDDGSSIVRRVKFGYGGTDTDTITVKHFTCSTNPCTIPIPFPQEGPAQLNADGLAIEVTQAAGGAESGALTLTGAVFTLSEPFEPDGDLNCTDENYASDGDGSITRLFDVDSESPECTALPYRLSFDGQTLTFEADYTVLQGVEPQFAFEATWYPELIAFPGTGNNAVMVVGPENPPADKSTFLQAVPLSTQQFLGTDPEYFVDFCPGTPEFDASGIKTVVFPSGFEVDNDMSDFPGFQYGCLIERTVEILDHTDPTIEGIEACAGKADDEICVRVREKGYLRGDWKLTRGT